MTLRIIYYYENIYKESDIISNKIIECKFTEVTTVSVVTEVNEVPEVTEGAEKIEETEKNEEIDTEELPKIINKL